jgi:glucose/arabinose dehydrogenase
LFREDLGGDIHNDNPAEELNRFPEATNGSHYGYPFCWTEYSLAEGVGRGRGSVWAWPARDLGNESYTEEQCESLFAKSEVAMQGHSAPLGLVFYDYVVASERPTECYGGFPQSMNGYAFIAFHGSWNRDVPTGYKVVYVPMDENGRAAGEPVDLLAHESEDAQWDDGFRPVDVDFDACGRLLVTSDGTDGVGSKIVRIESVNVYEPSPVSSSSAPSALMTVPLGAPTAPASTPASRPMSAPTSSTSSGGTATTGPSAVLSVVLWQLAAAGIFYFVSRA